MFQEQLQVDESPEGVQQCPPAELRAGDHQPSAVPLVPPAQQPQGGDQEQLQRQTAQGDSAQSMGPPQVGQGWLFPEVMVQVRPHKLSQGWEGPEVTVQVAPQQWDRGLGLPQVTVQVRPQRWGHRRTGIEVTVKVGCDSEELNCPQNQGEDVSGNGQQLIPKQDQREQLVRSEDEGEPAVVELVPQVGTLSQKQDQGGEVTEPQQDQSQEEERVELQERQIGDTADLGRTVTAEQEHLEADLPSLKEGQRAAEMRQEQSDAPEGLKGMAEDQKEDLGQETSKKRPREAPNYFVAVPITDDQILDRIEDVQELIFTKEPNLLRALLPIQTMHLTLVVAHLGTEEEVKKAVLALKQSKAKVEAILQGQELRMAFRGIGQFNNQVVYVKMLEETQKMLSRVAEAVEECFMEMNLDISGSKDFKPHLTFLKLSKASGLKRRGFRRICPDLYEEYEDSYFGTEVFSQLDLCAMRKKKQESGYYYCECSIDVGSKEGKQQGIQAEEGGAEPPCEDLPGSSVKNEMGAAAGSLQPSSCSADDKPSENIAETSTASREKGFEDVKGQPEATDGPALAAGESCS